MISRLVTPARQIHFSPLLTFLLLAVICVSQALGEDPTPAAQEAISSHTLLELREAPVEGDTVLAAADVPAARTALWEKYREMVLADEARRAEHESNDIAIGGSHMRFGLFEMGERPETGYPLYIALHGGGRAPAQVNDQQWNHMHVYYRRSVDNGVYIAPRGIEDQSDLHSRYNSYAMYDRMIEDAIVFHGVDPNRVYLMGFSAGGDGTYQIATRMPDRFGAANMSAGHPNDAKPANLMNLPLALQVGQNDDAYSRNTRTAEYFYQILAERERFGGDYPTEVFVHIGRPHNFHDEDPAQNEYAVIANPQAWLDGEDGGSRNANTNAVAWVNQYTRNPTPEHVILALHNRNDRPRIPSAGLPGNEVDLKNFNYWLDVSAANLEGLEFVEAAFAPGENKLTVQQPAPGLRLLLTEGMIDFDQPVTVEVEGQTLTCVVRPNVTTLARTLTERCDPSYMFAGEIKLERADDGQWSLWTP